jgi:hypothetical protein
MLKRQEEKGRLAVFHFDVSTPDFDVANEREHRFDATRVRQLSMTTLQNVRLRR